MAERKKTILNTLGRYRYIPLLLLFFIVPFVLFFVLSYSISNKSDGTGTLVFLMGKGSMDDAIKDATGEVTHVGILIVENGKQFVVDATPRLGVAKRTFEEWRRAKDSTEVVVCLKPKFYFNEKALREGCRCAIGKPYDSAFREHNDRYYCSELVQAVYCDWDLMNIFHSQPMNWKSQDGSIAPYWTEWFGRIGEPIPEGEPGTNPQQIFDYVKPRSKQLILDD